MSSYYIIKVMFYNKDCHLLPNTISITSFFIFIYYTKCYKMRFTKVQKVKYIFINIKYINILV